MILVFDEFSLDTQLRELRRSGRLVLMRPMVFNLLAFLVEHHDRLVTKQELLEHIWQDQAVSDSTLYSCIKEARQALGDCGKKQRIIKTLPKQGFLFLPQVKQDPRPTYPGLDAVPATNQPATTPNEKPIRFEPSSPRSETESVSYTVAGETKTVTMLVCTLEYAQELKDPTGSKDLFDFQQSLVSQAHQIVRQYSGTIQQLFKDGFLALFGAPKTMEDHAVRAILAADQLRRHALQARSQTGPAPKPKVALHIGPLKVGRVQDDRSLSIASVENSLEQVFALHNQAETGTILLSCAVRDRLEQQVETEPIGPIGPGHKEAFQLVSIKPQGTSLDALGARPLSRFVGREHELSTLEKLLQHVQAGQGHVLNLMGEPGIGKSRLLYELLHMAIGRGFGVQTGCCSSFGRATAFLPVLDIIMTLFNIGSADPAREVSRKVHKALDSMGMSSKEHALHVLHLLGMPFALEPLEKLNQSEMKKKTFHTLQEIMIQQSQIRPQVMVVEDLQWMDATSEEWLGSFVHRLVGAPILLLTSFRPGYHPPWMDKSYASQLSLKPLEHAHSEQIIQEILAPVQHKNEVVDTILKKAEGNPLFLEELAQTHLARANQSEPADLPDTIMAVIMTRMDQLPGPAKELLQIASVAGRSVDYPLLKAVANQPEPTLQRSLKLLQDSEFVIETRSSHHPIYRFKHVLTQEAAYQSMLADSCKKIHEKLARLISGEYRAQYQQQPELIAYHFTQADLVEDSLPYWIQAGKRAFERCAGHEAINHLNTSLQLLNQLPDRHLRAEQELEIHLILAPALQLAKGHACPEAEQAYSKARELSQKMGASWKLTSEALLHLGQGDLDKAIIVAAESLKLAHKEKDISLLIRSHDVFGISLSCQGKLRESIEHLQQVERLYDPTKHHYPAILHDPGVMSLSMLAMNLWIVGYPEQARIKSKKALGLAKKISHPFSLNSAIHLSGMHHFFRKEYKSSIQDAEEAVKLATRHHFPFCMAAATMVRGWGLAHLGQAQEGLSELQKGLDAWQEIEAKVVMSVFLGMLAETHLLLNQPDQAQAALEQAIMLTRKGERVWESELYRLQGVAWLSQPAPDQHRAELCFQKSLHTARAQHAKSLELRAAMSLARLWMQQNKSGQAHGLLGSVYEWFTEGFDTPDLQEAKSLLELLKKNS